MLSTAVRRATALQSAPRRSQHPRHRRCAATAAATEPVVPDSPAPSAASASALGGTPVKKTSVLVVGGTGTLGRQVVRRLLDDGYDVRCVVRPRPAPADFLRDWGASTVSADLSKRESLPAALVGVNAVVDCATARPEEDVFDIDWRGKEALIQSAAAMGVQRYVFFSIADCDKHPAVPLMRIKRRTEEYLESLDMPHTTLRLCGFAQALIGQYAVPILDEQSVWGSGEGTRVAYMDAVDVARLASRALTAPAAAGRTLTLAGPRAYSSEEIVRVCAALAGSKEEPKVNRVPSALLRVARSTLGFFQWSRSAADRLAFVEVFSADTEINADMTDTYALLGASEEDTSSVEQYLQEYFELILGKLKATKTESATKSEGFYL